MSTIHDKRKREDSTYYANRHMCYPLSFLVYTLGLDRHIIVPIIWGQGDTPLLVQKNFGITSYTKTGLVDQMAE